MSMSRVAAADLCAFVVQEALVGQAGWAPRSEEIETGRFSSRFSRLGHPSGLESDATRPCFLASSLSPCTDFTVHEYRPHLSPGDSGLQSQPV